MIRLSTKGRYGTRLMLNLATRYRVDGDAIILKSISDEEGISIRYLEQIIIPLKINKLVKSIRGAGGGYTLAKDPSRDQPQGDPPRPRGDLLSRRVRRGSGPLRTPALLRRP